MNTITEQSILCINIAVLLRRMNHKQPVPCNELNTVVVLLEGPVVKMHALTTIFYYCSETARAAYTIVNTFNVVAPLHINFRQMFGRRSYTISASIFIDVPY